MKQFDKRPSPGSAAQVLMVPVFGGIGMAYIAGQLAVDAMRGGDAPPWVWIAVAMMTVGACFSAIIVWHRHKAMRETDLSGGKKDDAELPERSDL